MQFIIMAVLVVGGAVVDKNPQWFNGTHEAAVAAWVLAAVYFLFWLFALLVIGRATNKKRSNW
jgi:hypothetical protein